MSARQVGKKTLIRSYVLVMQRMDDSDFRQLRRRIQALVNLCQGTLTQKNIKNEGRSEDVVENTGPPDIVSGKKIDFLSENTKIREISPVFGAIH